MKTRSLSILPLLLLALLAWLHSRPAPPPPTPAPPVKPAPEPKKPTLYVFSMASCPWCVKLEKSLADPRVEEALKGYDVQELDISSPEGREYKARSAPTLVIVGRASKPEVKVGYQTPEKLLAWLKLAEGPGGRIIPETMKVDTTVTVNLPPEVVALAADAHADRPYVGAALAVLLACVVAVTLKHLRV